MTTYSFKPAEDSNPERGAVIYENDVPVLRTAHLPGWEKGDHDDLAEHICSMLTLIGASESLGLEQHDERAKVMQHVLPAEAA